ncbi:hypothetical protein J2X31_003551 [Flavobacterium arsenatis]|uniref:Uncharacterized protein n=1 Tax=Flavobacterium arsenatis TaxID=1484332 RepID=A0ABU1TUG7_9FLAO|nr:hypothetical protein [Flavobacterium arsenatis]MDR6969518.1 hypothetical protein [Flavobacterium arsenatis]
MKKLIVMGVFALGSMVSFADNGQKELILEKFNAVITANSLTVESQESSVSSTASYEITIWITICETLGDGSTAETSYGIPTGNPTPCLDANGLAFIKTNYETLYLFMYPNACKIEARETLLEICD